MLVHTFTAVAAVLAAVIFVQAEAAEEGFVVYKVGAASDCPYHFIQDAVDAAAANPGEDYVWIAMDQDYSDQHIVITDQDVIIEGGFTDCDDNDPGLDQTTISGTSGHSVFEIEGNSNVYLDNMVITGAQMDASHSGGGIYFGGQGSLSTYAVWVFANTAGYGGGIDVSPSGPTTVTLAATTVSGNTALVSGGGVRVEGETTLNVTHAPGDFNIYITQNAALGQGEVGYGGGVEVLGPAVANISALVQQNTAPYGAGIAALGTSNGSAFVNVFTTDPVNPVAVSANTAQETGGGIFLKPNADSSTIAKLCAQDFQIDGNSAINGAAIYADQDNGDGSIAFLNSAGCDPPPGGVACASGQSCNEIDDNIASGGEAHGASILIQSDGALDLNRVALRGNQGSIVVTFITDTENDNGGNYIHLNDCLMVENAVDAMIVASPDGWYESPGAAGTLVRLNNCTLANNSFDYPDTQLSVNANFLEITNSIIYQPGELALFFNGPAGDLTAQYILTNDSDSFAGYTGIVRSAPIFVDEAGSDYHQARNSPGVDFAPGGDGVDFDGNPRTVDLIDVANQWGPMDVGAYEIQTQPGCANSDTVFCDGFDG